MFNAASSDYVIEERFLQTREHSMPDQIETHASTIECGSNRPDCDRIFFLRKGHSANPESLVHSLMKEEDDEGY